MACLWVWLHGSSGGAPVVAASVVACLWALARLRPSCWGPPAGGIPCCCTRVVCHGALIAAQFEPILHCSNHRTPVPVQQDDGTTAACIGNPATAEFEVCRTSLLPGALKTLGAQGCTLRMASEKALHGGTACSKGVPRALQFPAHACLSGLRSARPRPSILAWGSDSAPSPPLDPNTGANRDAPLPVKLFEVSDVILLTGDKVRWGCRAAAAHVGATQASNDSSGQQWPLFSQTARCTRVACSALSQTGRRRAWVQPCRMLPLLVESRASCAAELLACEH